MYLKFKNGLIFIFCFNVTYSKTAFRRDDGSMSEADGNADKNNGKDSDFRIEIEKLKDDGSMSAADGNADKNDGKDSGFRIEMEKLKGSGDESNDDNVSEAGAKDADVLLGGGELKLLTGKGELSPQAGSDNVNNDGLKDERPITTLGGSKNNVGGLIGKLARAIVKELAEEVPDSKNKGYKPDSQYFALMLVKYGSHLLKLKDLKGILAEVKNSASKMTEKVKRWTEKLKDIIGDLAKLGIQEVKGLFYSKSKLNLPEIEKKIPAEKKKLLYGLIELHKTFVTNEKDITKLSITEIVDKIPAEKIKLSLFGWIKRLFQAGKQATKKEIKKEVKETIKEEIKDKVRDLVDEILEQPDKEEEEDEEEGEEEEEEEKEEEEEEEISAENAETAEEKHSEDAENEEGTKNKPKSLSAKKKEKLAFPFLFLLPFVKQVGLFLIREGVKFAVEEAAVKIVEEIVSLGKVKDTQESGQGYPTIQYTFDSKSYDGIIEQRLRSAMNKIEQASCVRFQGLSTESDRTQTMTLLRVTNPYNSRECSHEPVINEEENTVQLVLGLDCLFERDILHSLLHAIGLKDEVAHPQRDKFVRVMWNNIQPKYRKLFRIQVNEHFAGNPVEYDPLSIMHFHDRAFSSNGRATIVPVMPGLKIYPSNDLSTLDRMKLRILFGQTCNRRRLSDLMDSCKLAMKGDQPGQDAPTDDDDNADEKQHEEETDGENNSNIQAISTSEEQKNISGAGNGDTD